MNPVRDEKSWYTYVLRSLKDRETYTGSTSDLRKRFKQHRDGLSRSTKGRRPLELIYYEMCRSGRDARSRELFLKSGMGKRYLKNRLKGFLPARQSQSGAGGIPQKRDMFINSLYLSLSLLQAMARSED